MVGSVGVFALAVFQAQVGCSGDEAASAPPSEPAQANPAVVETTAEPVVAEPAVVGSTVDDTAAAEPTTAAQPATDDDGVDKKREVDNEDGGPKVPVFMGASKSGIVMERPQPQKTRPKNAAPNAAPQAVTPQQAEPPR